MRAARLGLGLLGLLAAGYGALRLLDRSEDLVHVGAWFAGAIALHDGVLAPATIAAAVLARRILRRPLPGPVVAGAIVLATVSLAAVPVLGRFGARPDNPTLLDRDYTAGWGFFAAVVAAVVLAALLLQRTRGKRSPSGVR